MDTFTAPPALGLKAVVLEEGATHWVAPSSNTTVTLQEASIYAWRR